MCETARPRAGGLGGQAALQDAQSARWARERAAVVGESRAFLSARQRATPGLLERVTRADLHQRRLAQPPHVRPFECGSARYAHAFDDGGDY